VYRELSKIGLWTRVIPVGIVGHLALDISFEMSVVASFNTFYWVININL
jgi:hypothetical protein